MEEIPDDLWRTVERASSWALQGEVTLQTRLNNFLLADSILILSWATLFSARSGSPAFVVALAMLALLSAAFSAAWAVLGGRWSKYNYLQWDLATDFERKLPADYWFGVRVDELRQHQGVEGPSGRTYQITGLERVLTNTRLLSWVPGAFCLVSLVMFGLSFVPR